MKRCILGLALAAWPAFGGGAKAPVVPITLYTQFQQAAPAGVQEAIQDELTAIMAPIGLQFDWHPLAEAGGRVTSQLAIIRFKGECDTNGLRPESGFPGPLGWTHISDGEIIPFIDVNCDGLRLFVQRDLLGIPTPQRDPEFGRAAARVLAHELYHLLGNTKSHAGSGIAKAAYSVQELLAPVMQFGKKESLLLHGFGEHINAQALVAGQ